jgi:hypothetical protein
VGEVAGSGDNHLVEAFAAQAADPAFGVRRWTSATASSNSGFSSSGSAGRAARRANDLVSAGDIVLGTHRRGAQDVDLFVAHS